MTDFHGCYKERWQGEITPEAFSHPAKVSRGLARKIYAYAIEQGWLKPGDTCLDPFAGIGGFALDALANGLNFVGVELEQNFVDMGAGCDCTGISKADWVACFGRWKRFAHRDGRHWCPRCLAETGGVIEPRPPSLPGMGPKPTASYERNSGKIPYTEPHRYIGNLDLFARHARNGATAVLVRGDSRRLVEVLEGARAEGIIASPPWQGSTTSKDKEFLRRKFPMGNQALDAANGYGISPAQLGNMPTGEPPQAVIGSPPHGVAGVGHDAGHPRLDATEDVRREAEGCKRRPAYGESDGQLAVMREGNVDAVIASPPLASSLPSGTLSEKMVADLCAKGHGPARGSTHNATYGTSDGQLAALPEGEPPQVEGLVSSPPWESTEVCQDKAFWLNDGRKVPPQGQPRYGNTTGQLGQETSDTFWSAARAILLQCHQVLAPGGVAIWVLKAFVRNKAIVDFPGQWETLCESCGFETMEVIRAWLIEDRGAQFALNGDLVKKRVARKSFFRRLHESKYPNLAIDYEVVLITRKEGSNSDVG